ncbi:MAG: hypothetical protein LBF63_10390, partial [Treponema sp.]|nr:hypothetical protein [Treponema sp.]
LHLLRLAGLRRPKGSGEAEWAREIDRLLCSRVYGKPHDDSAYGSGYGSGSSGDSAGPCPCYELYRRKTAARFAPDFGEEDFAPVKTSWSAFISAYRRTVPLWRRALSWILPLGLPRSGTSPPAA